MNTPKLIAFDMYETRLDKGTSPNPYKKLFSTLGISKEIANQLARTLMTSEDAIEDILAKYIVDNKKTDLALNEFHRNLSNQLEGLKIYPDFEDAIAFAKGKGYKTAVVSNLSKPYAYPLNHMIPQDTFDYKALSFELGFAKPDPRIFKYLEQQSGISPEETVMIGDSFNADVKGSFDAGIQAIHINRHKKGITNHMRYIQISSLKELEEVLT